MVGAASSQVSRVFCPSYRTLVADNVHFMNSALLSDRLTHNDIQFELMVASNRITDRIRSDLHQRAAQHQWRVEASVRQADALLS